MRSHILQGISCLTMLLCCGVALSEETATTLAEFYSTDSFGIELESLAAATATPSDIALRIAPDADKDRHTAESEPAELPSPAPNSSEQSVGCGDACCESVSCCKTCPCTYGWADAMILWRVNRGSDRPLVLNLNSDDRLISTYGLDFGTAGGIRAGYGFRDCSHWGWEFEYLGVYDEDSSKHVSRADELALPGDLGLATNNFYFADEVSVRYESQLNNAEVNRVHCCGDCCGRSVEFLYGFRYLNLNEEFKIVSTDFQEGTSTYGVHTNNNLFGAQIGSRVRHCVGKWSWEGTGKAGIYGNAVDRRNDPIVDFPAFLIRPGHSSSEGAVAFVSDLNLSAIYRLSDAWGFRAGYNLIWIEGVALSPDQLDFTNTTDSGKHVSTDGGLLLHGVNMGLEARW